MIDSETDSWNENVDPFRDWDAAYLLGALSSDERRSYERHLSNCAACTSAVGDLAGIPGFLTKINLEAALEISKSPYGAENPRAIDAENSIQNLARRVIERKKYGRRRLVGAMAVAAAFLMVIGIGIGARIQSSANMSSGVSANLSAGRNIEMVQLKPNVMTVTMRVASKKWGTQFQWSCIYAEERSASETPEAYDLVVTDTSGAKIVVATWRELGKSATGLIATTSIPLTSIRAVDIRGSGSQSSIVHGEV